jgi:L-threonylcarbamoyladenylate synthase
MIIVQESPAALVKALAVLRSGGVVIHATETCYGIACDLTNENAVRHLFAVKQRPPHQTVSALFSSFDAARIYIDASSRAEELSSHLPGPLTLVLPRTKGAPRLWLTMTGGGEDPWIGIRVSSHPFAAALAKAFGKPIATTSANIHGASNPYSMNALREQFGDSADVVVIDSGDLPVTPPSTVVEVKNGDVRVLRYGDVRIIEM